MNDAQNLAGVAASSSGLGKAFAASSAKYAAGGLLIGTVSAVSVFMAVTMPKTKGDFFASIMSTVMASMCGGAYDEPVNALMRTKRMERLPTTATARPLVSWYMPAGASVVVKLRNAGLEEVA
jgi:hypothetical protein